MRKIIVFALFITLASFAPSCNSSDSKKHEAVATPEAVINAFNTKYPGVTDVVWEKEIQNGITVYEGDFKSNNKKIKAQFDENGNFLKEK